jgi:DNA-binding transcriptional regulator PaaX
MNERIKELAQQCWNLPDIPEYANYRKFNQEKFAELIVRECAEVVYNRSGHAQPQDLLEHFGVE